MESRRRLLLLALIIVAVALGAAGAVLLALQYALAPLVAAAPDQAGLLREAFRTAAPLAAAALLILLTAGLVLAWRMTAPLLRSLESSEARYRTLFSSTAEGVLVVGEVIEECNDRLCELFRVRREDVIGSEKRGFLRRQAGIGDEERFEAQVRQALATGQSFPWEFHLRDGSVLSGELALRRLRVDGRELTLLSLRDVSQREQAKRELQQAGEALRQARDRLAHAGNSAVLVELASGIAHEINQPLAAIANYARACRRLVQDERAAPAEVLRALDCIDQQARRAGESIRRIRAVMPVVEGPAERACINRLAQEVVELMREEIAAGGVQVHLQLATEPLPVLADAPQVQQVLVQLLRNALDAVQCLPPDQREVVLRTGLRDGQVEVQVSDSGRGISEEALANLFSPFFSTKERGMGMGLAMSMSIIKANHGDIGVDHADGGACFWFRLPVDTEPATE